MPSYLDIAVFIIVFASGLLALLRGLTREVLAIMSWVAATAAAYFLHPLVASLFKPYIQNVTIVVGAAIVVVFFLALIATSLISLKVSDIILNSSVGAVDRSLGFMFGAARGFLLAVVAFLFFGWFVPNANQPVWVKDARAEPILSAAAERLRLALPEDVEDVIAHFLNGKKGAPNNDKPQAENVSDDSRNDATPTPDMKPEFR